MLTDIEIAIEEDDEDDVENVYSALWKSPGAKRRFDSAEVLEHVNKLRYSDCEIAVGTDSQYRGNYLFYITVICLWNRGKGGTYYYRSEFVQRQHANQKNQKLRMFEEVTRTLEVANLMYEKIGIKPICHVDASLPNKKEYTSSFSEQLKGYVISSGYDCVLKPGCYAANCIADKHTKRKLRAKEI